MTATSTATAKALTIPAAGLRFETAAVTVTAMYVNGAGYKVQVRINGEHRPELGGLYTFDTDAIRCFNAAVEQAEAGTPAEIATATVVKLTAPKVGATKMSPAEVVVIGQALDSTGHIRRGRGAAAADLASLLAMAKRGFIALTGQQFRPNGGDVTDWGKRIYKETVAAAEAEQDRNDRINRVLAYTAA